MVTPRLLLGNDMSDKYRASLEKIRLANMMANPAGGNCGVGHGGFQPGNTCARGGVAAVAKVRARRDPVEGFALPKAWNGIVRPSDNPKPQGMEPAVRKRAAAPAAPAPAVKQPLAEVWKSAIARDDAARAAARVAQIEREHAERAVKAKQEAARDAVIAADIARQAAAKKAVMDVKAKPEAGRAVSDPVLPQNVARAMRAAPAVAPPVAVAQPVVPPAAAVRPAAPVANPNILPADKLAMMVLPPKPDMNGARRGRAYAKAIEAAVAKGDIDAAKKVVPQRFAAERALRWGREVIAEMERVRDGKPRVAAPLAAQVQAVRAVPAPVHVPRRQDEPKPTAAAISFPSVPDGAFFKASAEARLKSEELANSIAKAGSVTMRQLGVNGVKGGNNFGDSFKVKWDSGAGCGVFKPIDGEGNAARLITNVVNKLTRN